uniref:Uncharacterized protein n=1 Tax=Arundo donax TaxID=35708 RepID=A0A0A9FEY6_ARUDO
MIQNIWFLHQIQVTLPELPILMVQTDLLGYKIGGFYSEHTGTESCY